MGSMVMVCSLPLSMVLSCFAFLYWIPKWFLCLDCKLQSLFIGSSLSMARMKKRGERSVNMQKIHPFIYSHCHYLFELNEGTWRWLTGQLFLYLGLNVDFAFGKGDLDWHDLGLHCYASSSALLFPWMPMFPVTQARVTLFFADDFQSFIVSQNGLEFTNRFARSR